MVIHSSPHHLYYYFCYGLFICYFTQLQVAQNWWAPNTKNPYSGRQKGAQQENAHTRVVFLQGRGGWALTPKKHPRIDDVNATSFVMVSCAWNFDVLRPEIIATEFGQVLSVTSQITIQHQSLTKVLSHSPYYNMGPRPEITVRDYAIWHCRIFWTWFWSTSRYSGE